MPRANPERRHALTDAAIALLASQGVHGLTHRSVERSAGLPAGTASNYFRSRGELLAATARRVVELHLADMERAVAQDVAARSSRDDGDRGREGGRDALGEGGGDSSGEGRRDPSAEDGRDAGTAAPATMSTLTELIAASLEIAATVHRDRYLAIFELLLESRRRPELGQDLAGLALASTGATATQHANLGVTVPPEAEPLLVTLYSGALFTLVTGPDGGGPTARDLAHAIVRGALS